MRKNTKLPTILTQEELDRFFAKIDDFKHRLWFRSLYYTGLRVSELCGVKMSNFNLKEKILDLPAEICKKKKPRRMPLPDCFLPMLETVQEVFQPDDRICNVGRHRVWAITKEYAKKAGIEKSVHPHTFRHCYCSTVYSKTKDIMLVQQLMNHSSLDYTRLYCHLDDTGKKQGIAGVFD